MKSTSLRTGWLLPFGLTLMLGTAHASSRSFIEPDEGIVQHAQVINLPYEITEQADFAPGQPSSTVGFKAPLRMTDPAELTTYSCYRIRNFSWSWPGDGIPAVKGKVRYPLSSCSGGSLPDDRPLVLFMHGEMMDRHSHSYLMAHLTRNGFVTASIDSGGSNDERARQAITYLNGLFDHWGLRDSLSGEIVLAGHSRGGEGAIATARTLHEEPELSVRDLTVVSVISIAGTDKGPDIGPDRETLTGQMTQSLLTLYGSRDDDVNGSEANVANLESMKTVFAVYDRAGRETGSDGLVWPGQHVDKAMVYLHGLTHRAFMGISCSICSVAGTVEGNQAAKAYLNAFLRWQVWGQTAYRDYLTGEQTPESLEMLTLSHQYSAGRRRVIDRFDNGDRDLNDVGGLVYRSTQGIISHAEGDLHALLSSSPHETGGARISWSNNNGQYNPLMLWFIPDQSVPFVGSLRNVSSFDVLSLRIGQVYDSPLNPAGVSQNIRVGLLSSAGVSSQVDTIGYRDIPPQDAFICNPFQCGNIEQADFSKSAMGTVRIPLSAFDNVDLAEVRGIYLYFNDPDIVTGDITIDSLEFVRDH